MRIYKARRNQNYVIVIDEHCVIVTSERQHHHTKAFSITPNNTNASDALDNVGTYEPLGEYPDNGEEANALRALLVEYCKRVTS